MTPVLYGLTLIWLSIIIGYIFLVVYKNESKHIDKWLEIKDRDVKNKEYNIFMTFDTKLAMDELNNIVDDYISRYVLYNFTINNKDYIGQEDAELLIREVTRSLVINLSELYLFYIKMLRNIDTDEDLVIAVRDIVKDRALLYITESNKPNL